MHHFDIFSCKFFIFRGRISWRNNRAKSYRERPMRIMKVVLVAMLLTAVFISAISCGGKTENTQLQTYSGHDFSFKYPKTFGVVADKVDENGAVFVSVSGIDLTTSENEYFVVSYTPGYLDSNASDLNQYLDECVKGVEAAGITDKTYQWSPAMETTHAGHRVVYKLYTVTSNINASVSLNGVLSTFFCDRSNRTFIISTVNSTTHDRIETSGDFMTYLDSFVCH